MGTTVDITHRLRSRAVTQIRVGALRAGHDTFDPISPHQPISSACECRACGATWPNARYRNWPDWIMRHTPPRGVA